MIGFSVPDADLIWVLSYEGLHRVTLQPKVEVWTEPSYAEDHSLIDPNQSLLVFNEIRLPMLGLHGGVPILRSPRGYVLDPHFESEQVLLLNADGSLEQEFTIHDLSGDWGYATFSMDGTYVLIGVPYELEVYVSDRA